jgi:hypothetical protein
MREYLRKLSGHGEVRLVRQNPRQRALMLALLAVVVAGVGVLGHWLGAGRAELDARYLETLIRRDRANELEIASLHRQLVDARLARSVDQQAAESLRDTITALRDEVAALREEATHYRNLLDPARGREAFEISAFELTRVDGVRMFNYHILLAKTDGRRDAVQGVVEVTVRGTAEVDGHPVEQVLSLTELAALDTYPLPFRFRYFQGLSGVMSLPSTFEPHSVVVKVIQAGRETRPMTREFDWGKSLS